MNTYPIFVEVRTTDGLVAVNVAEISSYWEKSGSSPTRTAIMMKNTTRYDVQEHFTTLKGKIVKATELRL